jgi:hypothetical protein
MERHLTRVNERCPHPVTLTPQGGFSLNESNLPHFASIIDFNIIFIRPIERGILHLEIFPREGGRITSLSINPGRSLTPAEHAIIDPLFSESPIQTIILHCDGYGNWYTITHEMIR